MHMVLEERYIRKASTGKVIGRRMSQTGTLGSSTSMAIFTMETPKMAREMDKDHLSAKLTTTQEAGQMTVSMVSEQ